MKRKHIIFEHSPMHPKNEKKKKKNNNEIKAPQQIFYNNRADHFNIGKIKNESKHLNKSQYRHFFESYHNYNSQIF